jgi:hypothetical protein
MLHAAHEGPAHLLHALRFLDVPRLVQVLAVHQRDEFRIVEKIFPDEGNQGLGGRNGIKTVELQCRFTLAKLRVSILSHMAEQIVLVAEVMIHHALVGFCPRRDIINPRTPQTLFGKLRLRRRKDAPPRVIGISGSLFLLCHSYYPGGLK